MPMSCKSRRPNQSAPLIGFINIKQNISRKSCMSRNCILIKENCYDTKKGARIPLHEENHSITCQNRNGGKVHAKQCTWQTKCTLNMFASWLHFAGAHITSWNAISRHRSSTLVTKCAVTLPSNAVEWLHRACRLVTICDWHNDDKCFDVLFDASHISVTLNELFFFFATRNVSLIVCHLCQLLFWAIIIWRRVEWK